MRAILALCIAVFLAAVVMPVFSVSSEEVEVLLDKLGTSKQLPDEYAMNELIKIGKPVITPTLERLKAEKQPWRQQYYLMILYSVADESVSDQILPFSDSNKRKVREWAIYNLAKHGNERSVPALISALNDSAIDPESKEFVGKRLQKLTGQSIEYRANMNPQQRVEAYKEWTDWWQTQQLIN